MDLCPFCEIDETRQWILKQYAFFKVLPSNPSLMPGHMLIVPNWHVARLSSLKPEEFSQLWRIAADIQERILALGMGCDISQHSRPFLPQDQYSIPGHLHIHVRPRVLNDELYQRVQIHEKVLFDERRLSLETLHQEMETFEPLLLTL